jgi:hypothetical protein
MRQALTCLRSSWAGFVHAWPVAGTHCRSSSQIGQLSGALSEGGYEVPQVEQTKVSMGSLAFGRRHELNRR